MKCHILFSEKNKKNISKCRLLKILPRVLSVKTGLEHLRLLHDNAPRSQGTLCDRVYGVRNDPCDYFLFPKLKNHPSGKRYNSRNAFGSGVYQYLIGAPMEEYENCFQKWIGRLKKVYSGRWGRYLEG